MGKTVLNIDRELIAEAQERLGTDSITATIEEALRMVVAPQARRRLLDRLADATEDRVEVLGSVRERQW